MFRQLIQLMPQPAVLATRTRSFGSAAETVMITIADAESKTAAALRQIGWDHEDAALQAEVRQSKPASW